MIPGASGPRQPAAFAFAAVLLTLLTVTSWGQDRPRVIHAGKMFDGTGAVLENQTIVLRHGLIEAVGPKGRVPIPADAEQIDASGQFVLPGLIDAHFHFNVRSDPKISPWLPLHFLANGVTTVFEMGNWIVEENETWVNATKARGLPIPRLLYSGPCLDGRNTMLPTQSHIVLDELDARRVTNRLIDQGATSIKVYALLPLSLVKVVVEEAHRRNVSVRGHLGVVDPRDAIAVGLDGIEHGNWLCQALLPPLEAETLRQTVLAGRDGRSFDAWLNVDPRGEPATRLIDLMLRHNVNLTATLAMHEPSPDAAAEDNRRKAWTNIGAFVVRYQQAGGSVAMGSHGRVRRAPHGLGLHREIAVHVQAGMSPADALRGATTVAAATLRLTDRGRIAPGLLADLLILSADPLADINNLSRVHDVILGGTSVDRARLLESPKTEPIPSASPAGSPSR